LHCSAWIHCFPFRVQRLSFRPSVICHGQDQHVVVGEKVKFGKVRQGAVGSKKSRLPDPGSKMFFHRFWKPLS
jgi:hypothetical protein